MIRTLLRKASAVACGSKSSLRCTIRSLQTVAEKVTDGFIEDLRSVVGKENVSTAEVVRDQHGHDESYHQTSQPDVVVQAECVDHVSRVARMCNDAGVPLVPFASATGLEGGVNAVKGGVCIDLNLMKNIEAVNAEDFDCTIACGVTRSELNSFIRDTGLQFPVDPGADATLCGMCATGASGTNAVRYGTLKENTLNLEAVLADGSVLWTAGKGKRCKKTSAGYNLTNLFVGSEGTLGIITKAVLRLHAIPEATLSAVVHFPSVQAAVDSTVQVLQCGIPMARIEFLDEVAIDALNKYSKFSMKVSPSLFLEFNGSPTGVKEQAATVEEICSSNDGSDFAWAMDPEERNRLWKARHELLYACIALIPESKPYTTDVCVPISKLPEVILRSKELIRKAGLVGAVLGHVGDGNFHTVILGDPWVKDALELAHQCSHGISELALELNGTCTGEHGIGMGKRDLLAKEMGMEGITAMRIVKQAFDPNNILNPGKIFL